MAREVIIKKLETPDIDQVSRFRLLDLADKPIQQFIRRDALRSGQANLTRTYVAKHEGETKIAGYISLMCAEVAFERSYSIADKAGADRYEFQPAVRIARLGVDAGSRSQGIGRMLVEAAIGIVQAAIQPTIGCRFIILDAKQKSVSFYEKLGFRLLATTANDANEMPLMFLDLQDLN